MTQLIVFQNAIKSKQNQLLKCIANNNIANQGFSTLNQIPDQECTSFNKD